MVIIKRIKEYFYEYAKQAIPFSSISDSKLFIQPMYMYIERTSFDKIIIIVKFRKAQQCH